MSEREGDDGASTQAASPSWRAARFAVVDLETTGMDPDVDEIISWAVVPVEQGLVRIRGVRSGLVRPRSMPAADTITIHGLRPADLEGAPPLEVASRALTEALSGRRVVAHAAFVERSFLRRADVPVAEPIIDTAALGAFWLEQRGTAVPRLVALGALARALGLPAHRPHNADADALTTAQVFLALATHLEALGMSTVDALEELCRPRRTSFWERLTARRSGRSGG